MDFHRTSVDFRGFPLDFRVTRCGFPLPVLGTARFGCFKLLS